MKMFSKWIRPSSAPPDDLIGQRDAARRALEAAELAQQRAQDAFDSDGSLESEASLSEARVATERATLHFDRAARLARLAEEQKAREALEATESRIRDINAELASSNVRAAVEPMLQREAELFTKLAELRAERTELGDHFNELGAERQQLMASLGRELEAYGGTVVEGVKPNERSRIVLSAAFRESELVSSDGPVVAALERRLSSMDRNDRVVRELAAIIQMMQLASGRLVNSGPEAQP